tara:strand:- start:18363 stop:18803 length:441 start_codon:yes stop_codon:yes gene_type:complete
MEIKSLITPIGAFNSFYVNSLLAKLVYVNKRSSSYPPDLTLQKIVDKFFSNSELKNFPKYYLQGTPFQLSVWKALAKIPKGHTESYSSLASKIGIPGAARAVGTACKLNPIPLLIPCHRVIKQDGSIGEFALGKANKEYLLTMESK